MLPAAEQVHEPALPQDPAQQETLSQALQQLAPSTQQLVADLFHGRFIGIRRVPDECFDSHTLVEDFSADEEELSLPEDD